MQINCVILRCHHIIFGKTIEIKSLLADYGDIRTWWMNVP